MSDMTLTPEDRYLVERAAHLHLYHTLATQPELSYTHVLPSMVSDFVDGNLDEDRARTIADAVNSDIRVYSLYKHLLECRSTIREITQIAAAAGPQTKLVLDKATLSWVEIGGKYLLLLQMHDGGEGTPDSNPTLHLEWEGRIDRIVFSKMTPEGTAQYLLDDGDARIHRLRDDAGKMQPTTSYRIVV